MIIIIIMTMTMTISSVVIEVIGDILFFLMKKFHIQKKSIKSKQTTILLYA